MNRQCRIDAQFCLGDLLVNMAALPGSYWTEERAAWAQDRLRSDFLACNKNSFFVAGNHDGAGAISASPKIGTGR